MLRRSDHVSSAGEREFEAHCRRARRRFVAAALLVLGSACGERERWPEPDRIRPGPARIARTADPDCAHGEFCSEAGPKPEHGAAPPFDDCEASPPLPPDVVAKTAEVSPSLLRVRFDRARTERARVADRAGACCYVWYEHCHGRPILVRGKPSLPRSVSSARTSVAFASLGERVANLGRARRSVLARAWRRIAAFEHASIRSFERAAGELSQHGAPRELIEATSDAARDEARHAELAFGIASAFAGRHIEAAPMHLAKRELPTLAGLAVATYVEGCVAETIAASLVGAAARQARDPQIRKVLAAVGRDEAKHAELAWKTIAWAISVGGEPVRDAIAKAAEEIALEWTTVRRGRVAPTANEDFGILAPLTRRALARRAFDRIVLPGTAALLDEARARG